MITSRDNALFKSLRKLAQTSRERKKSGLTLLDGTHLVADYTEHIGPPQMLFVSDSGLQRPEIRALLERSPTTPLTILSDTLLQEISPVEAPSGILAQVAVPLLPIKEKVHFAVFLEAIQDPGNMGSILRSAAAAGAEVAYLSPGCADAWAPKVLRGGMGAHFVLPIREMVDLVATAKDFAGEILVTSLQAETSLFDLNLTSTVAFVIGNEGVGVSPALQKMATRLTHIPMPGAMESLNAAAAAAVCFFERVRQTS